MKNFEFNTKDRHWDTYRTFYYTKGAFTEFETGELIVNCIPNLDRREHNDRYGIQLTTTAAHDCPKMYLDKDCTTAVPVAWLTQNGQQHVAVDWERKVVVGLGHKHVTPDLPRHLRFAKALWCGPERLPIPLSKITVSQPDKAIKADIREKLAEVRAVVTAAVRVRDLREPYHSDKFTADPRWVDKDTLEIVENLCSNDHWLQMAAFNGFSYPRANTPHDYLYIK